MQRCISYVLKHRKIQSCYVYGAGSHYCCLTTTESTAKLRVLSDLLLVVQCRPKKSICHANSDIAPLFVHCNLWSHIEGSSRMEYSIIKNFCSHFHGCQVRVVLYQGFTAFLQNMWHGRNVVKRFAKNIQHHHSCKWMIRVYRIVKNLQITASVLDKKAIENLHITDEA
jgi:hypothetical protein